MKKLIIVTLLILGNMAFADAQTCAVAYRYSQSPSEQLVLSSQQSIADLNDYRADRRTDWDNLISFVEVAPGCTLLAYQYQNFNRDNYSGRQLDGFVAIFDNNSWHQRYRSYDLTGTAYNNSISSLKCFCR